MLIFNALLEDLKAAFAKTQKNVTRGKWHTYRAHPERFTLAALGKQGARNSPLHNGVSRLQVLLGLGHSG